MREDRVDPGFSVLSVSYAFLSLRVWVVVEEVGRENEHE